MGQRSNTAEYRVNAVKLSKEMGAKAAGERAKNTSRYAIHVDKSSKKWRLTIGHYAD